MSTPRSTFPQHRWLAVAAAVNDRMAELCLDQADLVEETGLSAQVLRDLRRGVAKGYRPTTLVKVATALEWPADAFPRMLAGAAPVAPAPTAGRSTAGRAPRERGRTTSPELELIASQVHDLERALAGLRRDLARAKRGA